MKTCFAMARILLDRPRFLDSIKYSFDSRMWFGRLCDDVIPLALLVPMDLGRAFPLQHQHVTQSFEGPSKHREQSAVPLTRMAKFHTLSFETAKWQWCVEGVDLENGPFKLPLADVTPFVDARIFLA